MSKTEALEMTSSRSRSSSSIVQAFALFSFFPSVSPGHARFRALDAAEVHRLSTVRSRTRLRSRCPRAGHGVTIQDGTQQPFEIM
jgi:hypothetical protein